MDGWGPPVGVHGQPLWGSGSGRKTGALELLRHAVEGTRGATQGTRGTTQGTGGSTQGTRGSTQGTRDSTQGIRSTTLEGTRGRLFWPSLSLCVCTGHGNKHQLVGKAGMKGPLLDGRTYRPGPSRTVRVSGPGPAEAWRDEKITQQPSTHPNGG